MLIEEYTQFAMHGGGERRVQEHDVERLAWRAGEKLERIVLADLGAISLQQVSKRRKTVEMGVLPVLSKRCA